MKLSAALVMNVLFFGLASASAVAGAKASTEDGVPSRQLIEHAQPMRFSSSCAYRALTFGPAVELSPSSQVTLTRNETLLSIDDEDSYAVYDLLKAPPEQQIIEADKADDVPPATAPISVATNPGAAQRARFGEGERLRTVNQFRVLKSGRALTMNRLYGNVFFLTVGPSNRTQYDQLARDLLNGSYCGVPFETLSPEQKQAAAYLAKFFILNSFSSGRLDDYDSWLRYRKIAETFLIKDELADLLEDYAYRATEVAKTDPTLSKIDPDKVWSFAWNAVAELFHDKDFVKFADLSTFQSNGRIAFMLLGVEPIAGGQINRFGFYTKQLAAVKAAGFHAPTAFAWNWTQDQVRYSSTVVLRAPRNKSFARQSAFPADGKNGLIVLDATFAAEDVAGVVDEYTTALRSEGFEFTERRAIADLPDYIGRRFLAAPRIDYLVREGHADGDDDNVMTVYDKGYVVEGKKTRGNDVESVSIVFGDAAKAQEKRISRHTFKSWVNKYYVKARKPFVYLNTSCWGIEKEWVDLGYLSSEKFIEIASSAPVNYFSASHVDPVRIIMDGIRRAESFAAVRSRLTTIASYASGHEDRFIFPDEEAYPAPFALLDRSLFVKKAGEKILPYVPDGYF